MLVFNRIIEWVRPSCPISLLKHVAQDCVQVAGNKLNNTRLNVEPWGTPLVTGLQPVPLITTLNSASSQSTSLSTHPAHPPWARLWGCPGKPCWKPFWSAGRQHPLLSPHVSSQLSHHGRQSGWLSMTSLWWIRTDYSWSPSCLLHDQNSLQNVLFQVRLTGLFLFLSFSEDWGDIYFLPVPRPLSWLPWPFKYESAITMILCQFP